VTFTVTVARKKRRRAFAARSIAGIRPEAQPVDWFDDTTPGLALRVAPGGTKTWYLFYKKGRTTRRVKLGTWPSTKLATAREAARAKRVDVDGGGDPAHERRQAREAFMVGDLCTLYLNQHAKVHKSTWKDDHWRLERYVLPAWKTRPVADIGRPDVHALIDKIAAAGKPIQANRTQALVSKIWSFAVDRGHVEHNPCYRMSKAAPERARETVLSDDDLRALWAALDAQPGDASDALRLRLLTGQRGGEVHTMEWPELDLTENAAVWSIPSEKAKNQRAHRVPLAELAAEVLRTRLAVRDKKEDRVFPGLYHQREDLREMAKIHNGAYRWHDLRRTVATRLAALGFAEETIGRVLNHAKRGVTATIYNQYRYDAEKRAALEAWAALIQKAVGGKGGAA
jgi:integrase